MPMMLMDMQRSEKNDGTAVPALITYKNVLMDWKYYSCTAVAGSTYRYVRTGTAGHRVCEDSG